MMEGEQLRLAKGRKRLRALWELGRGERERKLRLDADELESMRRSSLARQRVGAARRGGGGEAGSGPLGAMAGGEGEEAAVVGG